MNTGAWCNNIKDCPDGSGELPNCSEGESNIYYGRLDLFKFHWNRAG